MNGTTTTETIYRMPHALPGRAPIKHKTQCRYCRTMTKKGRFTSTLRGSIGSAGQFRYKCRRCGRTKWVGPFRCAWWSDVVIFAAEPEKGAG